MINYLLYAVLCMGISLIFLLAAYLSPHEESVMDIFFLAVSIVLGTMSINFFRKRRSEKKFRQY